LYEEDRIIIGRHRCRHCHPGNRTSIRTGDGTESNPYQITTPAQPDAVRNYLDKHFILKADLDLSKDYSLRLPIGKDEEGSANNFTVFSGSPDGDGHVVTGVNII
jgi:hypothetical protein